MNWLERINQALSEEREAEHSRLQQLIMQEQADEQILRQDAETLEHLGIPKMLTEIRDQVWKAGDIKRWSEVVPGHWTYGEYDYQDQDTYYIPKMSIANCSLWFEYPGDLNQYIHNIHEIRVPTNYYYSTATLSELNIYIRRNLENRSEPVFDSYIIGDMNSYHIHPNISIEQVKDMLTKDCINRFKTGRLPYLLLEKREKMIDEGAVVLSSEEECRQTYLAYLKEQEDLKIDTVQTINPKRGFLGKRWIGR